MTNTVYTCAARRVEHKWAKGAFTTEDGGECLLQSIASAMGITGDKAPLPQPVVNQIFAELVRQNALEPETVASATDNDLRRQAIWGWNDEDCREQRGVVSFLDILAARHEEEDVDVAVATPSRQLALAL